MEKIGFVFFFVSDFNCYTELLFRLPLLKVKPACAKRMNLVLHEFSHTSALQAELIDIGLIWLD